MFQLFKRNLVTKAFLGDQEEALDLEKERALYEQQHHHQMQLQNAHDEPEIARDAEQSRAGDLIFAYFSGWFFTEFSIALSL